MNTDLQLKLRALLGVAVMIAACSPDPNRSADAQDVRGPDEMFQYQVSATGDQILIDFTVLEGGYLYRDKFSFASSDGRVVFGSARFPRGEMHDDEFFGEQEIFRDEFQVAIPYTRTAATKSVELLIGLQGCDDIVGLCYPPQDWTASVQLPDGPIAAVPELAGRLFAGANSDEPLPVDQAFVGNVRFDAANEMTVSWLIAPGYYLYRDEFSFDVAGAIQLGAARLPTGVAMNDLNFGDTEVYYSSVEISVPFARAHPDEQALAITIAYRGCKDDSICYPPAEQEFALTLPASNDFPASAPPAMLSEQDRFSELIRSGSWLAFLSAFYGAGLLLSFTPCVLPMVPILSSIIAGSGQTSAGRGFALSVSYVLGMAITYTAAGALAALAGGQIQAVFQQPWIVASFAGLFVIMALGMFGLFEIQMPSAIQSRITALANRQKGGTFVGTAIVGALTALIVTTCVAPPLIGALAVIGQTGDVTRGASALFIMSIGMGTPLLLVGASAGKLLPKVGPWMNAVKAGFGVMMLGVAIWMLERVLPGSFVLALWGLLAIGAAYLLGAFRLRAPKTAGGRQVGLMPRISGIVACLYGVIMLYGAAVGGQSPFRPIPGGPGFGGQLAEGPPFMAIESVAELESLLAEARANGQPVLVDFTADWCSSCQEMESYTFPDSGVKAALEPFMLLRADITANNADDKALLAYFDAVGAPTMLFYDHAGTNLDDFGYTLMTYVPADEFEAHVERVAAL